MTAKEALLETDGALNPTSTKLFPTTHTATPETNLAPGSYEVWNVGGEETETLVYRAESVSSPRLVVVMIPGNPGVIDYYETFLSVVYEKFNKEIEIIGSHSSAVHHTKHYTVEDQKKHKIALLDMIVEKYGKDMKIVLIGHSFGSWVAVQVLKARPNANIVKVFGLFPTLHSMAVSPKGRRISYMIMPVVRTIPPLIVGFLRTLTYFTPSLFPRIVSTFTGQTGRDLAITCDKLLHYRNVQSTLHLASHEFREIIDLDEDVIEQHTDKFVLYYGTRDDWCPTWHWEHMSQKFPEAEVYLCRDDLPHAFVIGYSDVMGEKVSQWIEKVIDR